MLADGASRDHPRGARSLRDVPGITLVARDRSETYAQGIREGSPEAVQVADRWHLLKNLGEVLERVLQHHRAALERAATLASGTGSTAESAQAPVADVEDTAARQEAVETADTPTCTAVVGPPSRASPTRTKRQQLYERVHALRAQGVSIHAISQQTGVARQTVRKYLRADQCPERAQRRTSIGTWSDHNMFLRMRWNEGCRDAVVLWRELVARGFRGTLRTVQRHVRSWRRVDSPRDRTRGGGAGAATSPTQRCARRRHANCAGGCCSLRPSQSPTEVGSSSTCSITALLLSQVSVSPKSSYVSFAVGMLLHSRLGWSRPRAAPWPSSMTSRRGFAAMTAR
jgi:hypothetical protein